MRANQVKYVLRAESGLQMGAIFRLEGPRNTLGRNLEAAIPLDDFNASRDHAAIDLQRGLPYLVDLGSTNGTYINECRVQERTRLQLGDRLRVGSTVFSIQPYEKDSMTGWKEKTQVLMLKVRREKEISAEDEEDLKANRKSHFDSPLWKKLREPHWSRMDRTKKRAVLVAFCGVVILAAIATSFV